MNHRKEALLELIYLTKVSTKTLKKAYKSNATKYIDMGGEIGEAFKQTLNCIDYLESVLKTHINKLGRDKL